MLVISDARDTDVTSYLQRDAAVAFGLARAMTTELLFTFYRCDCARWVVFVHCVKRSADRVLNGAFSDDGTIVYTIAYRMTDEHVTV